MTNVNVIFLSTSCFLLYSQQITPKDMKFVPYSFQYLLQLWLLKGLCNYCGRVTVVEFLDVIWNLIPIIYFN